MKKIFISSTFTDMQFERDLVQLEVAPRLRRYAKEYGASLSTVDLRWGINTSEMDEGSGYKMAMRKVMATCLNEVRKCTPHMLIFLGERYGTTVEYNFEYKSLTALEIEEGLFSEKSDASKSIICLREGVAKQICDETYRSRYLELDHDNCERLNKLKEALKNITEDNIIEYTADWNEEGKCLENFRCIGDNRPLVEAIISKYQEIFMDEWKMIASLSWQERERIYAKAIYDDTILKFSERSHLLSDCIEKLRSNNVIALTGPAGCGKTSLLCGLGELLSKQNSEAEIFWFFAKQSPYSDDVRYLVQQMVYFLEEKLHTEEHYCEQIDELEKWIKENNHFVKENPTDEEREKNRIYKQNARQLKAMQRFRGWKARLRMLADMLTTDVYFMIDGIDNMSVDRHVNSLSFITNDEKLHFIITYSEGFQVDHNDVNYFEEICLPLLEDEEIINVAKKMFSVHSKEAYHGVLQEIVRKGDIAKNPFYLSMIIQKLIMMDSEDLGNSEDDIIANSIHIVQKMPDSLDKLVFDLLNQAVEKISDDGNVLWKIIHYIAATNYGLTEEDIGDILKMIGVQYIQRDFLMLTDLLDIFFVWHQDGRIDISRNVVRDSIRTYTEPKIENDLLDYLRQLNGQSEFCYMEGIRLARRNRDDNVLKSLLFLIRQEGGFERFLYLTQTFICELQADSDDYFLKVITSWLAAASDEENNFIDWFCRNCLPSISKDVYGPLNDRIAQIVCAYYLSDAYMSGLGDTSKLGMLWKVLSVLNQTSNHIEYIDMVERVEKEAYELVEKKLNLFGVSMDIYEYSSIEAAIGSIDDSRKYRMGDTIKDCAQKISNMCEQLHMFFSEFDTRRAEQYKEKCFMMKGFLKSEDIRKMKNYAKSEYAKGLDAFNNYEYEEAFESFQKALAYWEKSYSNSHNILTLMTLYAKSNEFAFMFYNVRNYMMAKKFLDKNMEYAKSNVFGENSEYSARVINISTKNNEILLSALRG